MSNNTRLKDLMQRHGIQQYFVAERLGVSEATLGRWLRFPLSKERYQQISDAVFEIEKERELNG